MLVSDHVGFPSALQPLIRHLTVLESVGFDWCIYRRTRTPYQITQNVLA